jgi:hypothetical protein
LDLERVGVYLKRIGNDDIDRCYGHTGADHDVPRRRHFGITFLHHLYMSILTTSSNEEKQNNRDKFDDDKLKEREKRRGKHGRLKL